MRERELDQMLSELGYEAGDTREIPRPEKPHTLPVEPTPSGRRTDLREADDNTPPAKRRPVGKFEVSPPPDALSVAEPEPISEEARQKREAYLRMLETEGTGEIEQERPHKKGALAGFVMFAMVVDVILMLVFGALFSVAVSVEKNPDYTLLSRRLFFTEERIPSYEIQKGDLVVFRSVESCAELRVNELVLCSDGKTNQLALVSSCDENSVSVKGLDGGVIESEGLYVRGKYDSHSPFLGTLFSQICRPELSSLLFLLPLILLLLLPIYSMVRRDD